MKHPIIMVSALGLAGCLLAASAQAQTPTPTPSIQEAGGFNILNLEAPSWMRWLGDGSESDPGSGGISWSAQGVHYYAALTVASGQTGTVTNTVSMAGTPASLPIAGLIAFVDGTCTIAGTITANGVTPLSVFANNGGGSGGGGGGTVAGNPTNLSAGAGFQAIASGGASGGSCGTGSGTTPTVASQKLVAQNLLSYGLCGGGNGGSGGAGGGAAGAGGGCVVLICHDLNFTSGATITANGNNGGNGGANPGGGGGGGGVVITAAANLIANTGSISFTHGAGGTGSTAGCAGGGGWSKQYSIL